MFVDENTDISELTGEKIRRTSSNIMPQKLWNHFLFCVSVTCTSVIGLLSVYLNIQEVRDDLHFVYLLIFSPVNSV
jgi:hypothetical protein